jgi:hypothetical protein
MIRRPTSVLPVKATLSTSGLDASSSPTAPPGPVTRLITPFGNSPVSSSALTSSSAVRLVFEAGLRTTELPVTSAGASFQQAIIRGKFQGMICAQTPWGSRLTKFHATAGMSTHGSGS